MDPRMSPEETRPIWAWYMVCVVTLLYILAYMDRAILALLVGPIKADLGISDVQMSLLLGLSFGIFYSLLSVPAGALVDRFSRRAIIFGGVLAWSAMTIVCGLSRSFTELFVARAGVAVGEAGLSPASFSLIRSSLPARRWGRAFGLYALGPVLGTSLSFALGGVALNLASSGAFAAVPVLGSAKPWQAVLMVIGAAGIPLSLLVLTMRGTQRPAAASEVARAPGVSFRDAARHVGLNRGAYLVLAIFAVCMSMLAFAWSAWAATAFGRNFGLAPSAVGLRLGTIGLVAAPLGMFATGWMIDRLGRSGRPDSAARVGIVTTLLATMLGTAVPLAPSLDSATALYVCHAAVYGVFYTVGATSLAALTPQRIMGKMTALYLLLQGVLGQSLGPTLVAAVGQNLFEGPRALGHGLSLISGAMGCVGFVCIVLLARALRGRERSGAADIDRAATGPLATDVRAT